MNKKLPTTGITNELKGSSVFFQPSPAENEPKTENERPQIVQMRKISPADPVTEPIHHDTMQPRHRDTTTPSNHDGGQPPRKDAVAAPNLDEIRKAVKQLGKDAATHRFTAEEKGALADIVYTYARQGLRTSENEITRIGVNWLLQDYHQNGGISVLARMLEELHR